MAVTRRRPDKGPPSAPSASSPSAPRNTKARPARANAQAPPASTTRKYAVQLLKYGVTFSLAFFFLSRAARKYDAPDPLLLSPVNSHQADVPGELEPDIDAAATTQRSGQGRAEQPLSQAIPGEILAPHFRKSLDAKEVVRRREAIREAFKVRCVSDSQPCRIRSVPFWASLLTLIIYILELLACVRARRLRVRQLPPHQPAWLQPRIARNWLVRLRLGTSRP